MPLSKRKLRTYQEYYEVILDQLEEFDDGTGHPVVLFREGHADKRRGKNSWIHLMCPCDLEWKWRVENKKRTLIHTNDEFSCPAKAAAREIVRAKVREKYARVWDAMSLADAVYDVFEKVESGEYFGEHFPGTLYLTEVELLLLVPTSASAPTPDQASGKEDPEVSRPAMIKVPFPGRAIRDAVNELRRRKLLDLNGMILVPYQESFRFPETLHHQFAYWIEEPLGWPNGEAGDSFMFELYKKISERTGWSNGEVVFGGEHIPDISPELKKHGVDRWLSRLDPRLVAPIPEDKHEILREISLERWIEWLNMIREEIHGATA